MVDHQVECLWSLISFLMHLFNVISKAISSTLERRRVSSHSDSSTSGTRLVSNLEEKKKIVVEHGKISNVKRARKRPAMIVVPESSLCCGPCEEGLAEFAKARDQAEEEKDMEVEGRGYGLASRKGKMHVMEDGYGVITDINDDSKQAFFGVFDGHGGRAAVDFVSKKLGQNIIGALAGGENKLEAATRLGYLTTDAQFLSQGVSSGACAATVLLNGRELLVGNVGDCRIVMSRNREAITLTSDHTPGRDDEKIRIESSGGYVSCRNGRWRVQDSLAVSRAIGDANLKEWIISEPETRNLHLTPECEFLIMASDGLWDKVTDQEAVDVVSKRHDLMKSCKDLVEMSCIRGNRDDITVMVVDLQRFVQES